MQDFTEQYSYLKNEKEHLIHELDQLQEATRTSEEQREGKGRRGRQWVSPSGRNLYMSLLLRPPLLPAEASLITLMAAVSLCNALRDLFQLQPQIKWPNDVLLTGGKTAGILAEMHAEQECIHFLVLGIGVNLNMTPEMFPEDIKYPATSLQIVLGRPVDRVDFTRKLLEYLDQGYDRFLNKGGALVRAKWLDYCAHIDHVIDVLEKWTLSHTVDELVEKGQLMHFPWAKVTTIPELVRSPQMAARQFFTSTGADKDVRLPWGVTR